MCTAKELFESSSVEDLSKFLIDVFSKNSNADDARLDESTHIENLHASVKRDFLADMSDVDLSHKLWAVATIRAQFARLSRPDARMPEMLGSRVYNNPVFLDTFFAVRARPELLVA